MAHPVTRAHLKQAVDAQDWDLLDALLELDPGHVDDRSLYTDTWGEWWGLLLECVRNGAATGVRVLLKHGADRSLGNRGDCIPCTPLELARERELHDIVALLEGDRPTYERSREPELPALDAQDERVNRQGEVADATGLVFPTEAFED